MPEGRAATTAIVIAQLAFGLLSLTICLPSMQEWPAQFGASQAAVQLTFSAYVLTYGGMQLVYGPWSDRIGRKRVLIFGLAVAFAGSLLAALAPSLTLLVAARALQGAGCAATIVMGRALVHDLYEGRERTRVMALVGMTMGVIPPVSTLLGGQLHVRLGWQANFVVLAMLALVLLVAATRLPTHEKPKGRPPARLRDLVAGYAALAREHTFIWYALLLAATTATFYAFLAGAPIVLRDYGVTPDRLGWYIMTPPLAYIAGNMITARLIRSMREFPIMLVGEIITLAGLVVALLLGLFGPHTPLALTLPLLFLGIGHGLLVPLTLTGTVGLVPALAGSAAAVAGVMQQLGGAVGGYTVGLVPGMGQTHLAVVMLGWCAVGLFALLCLRPALRK